MQLILIEEQRLHRCQLPEKIAGRYWIKRSSEHESGTEVLCVEGVAGQWVLKSNRAAQLFDKDGKPVREREVEPGKFYSVQIEGQEKKALIYSKPITRDRRTFTKYQLPQDVTLSIGRAEGAALHFANPFASGKHATLAFANGIFSITDNKSSNGTFVNDERVVTSRQLKPGDVVTVIDLSIVIGGDFIAVNNPDGNLKVTDKLTRLKPQKVQIVVDEDEEIEESSPEHLFFRSPRMRRSITPPKVKIDSPPAKEKQDDRSLIMIIGPAMTMGMGSGVMAMFMVMNARATGNFAMAIPMVIMSITMMTGMIAFPLIMRRQETKKRAENEIKRKEKYREYLAKMSVDIENEKEIQAEILHENYADLAVCVNRIRERERSLWERTGTHEDFLDVRFGIGDWPFEADYQVPERGFTLDDDTLQDELFKIVDAPRVVREVPVVVSLIKRFSLGIIGERFETTSFIKSLIFQLASLHAYDEVKFVFIYGEHESEQWDFVRWLPHVWSEDKSFRFVATDIDQVRQLSVLLEQVLAGGKSEDGRPVDDDPTSTKYVVFALDRHLAAKCEALNTVFRAQEYAQVSVMAIYDELRYLPKDCKVILELNPDYSKIFDRSTSTDDYVGFVPDRELELDAQNLAIQLANTKLESAEAAFELPMMLTFLEMFEAGRVEHLNVLTRWKESNPVQTLEAAVGVDVTGNIFNLDLHEKAHGPHGLVAGMTGSGKSEFIMTYILSVALNYHPHEVAFVLIDYKGGGMANAFSELPHTVGVITNLDGASVNRSLASIQSELKRRQSIFNDATERTQISNIDIYKYQSLFREGQVDEPLPHLIIISDEFAELKTQQPEFMQQLVSAARIGRSLGVHLILATQKPSGVVDDQIWANSKFKVCLKVQERADSMEMLKRPDAAKLVETGRFYLQVGYNELFEMGQSAWAGAPYSPSDRIERDYDDSVALLDIQGRPTARIKPQKAATNSGKTKQLDEVTNYLIRTAKEEKVSLKQLWMPPLKETVYLEALAEKYKEELAQAASDKDSKLTAFTLTALMGEYDDPSTQSQGMVSLSLTHGGNLLLFGITGGGKTSFVNTFLYSLLRDHTPEQLNCYLLDFGSETLTSFAPAPHVGDVLISGDIEKIENLFDILNTELARRKKLFIEYGGDFQSYIEEADETVPNILVVINNYAAFAELFDDCDEWLSLITREGVKYGIYFIITADVPNVVRFRVQQNFKQTICLQLNDKDEYMGIFGRLEGLLPAPKPGRGLMRIEDSVYEFHTALISEELADSPRALRRHCQELAKGFTGIAAEAVPSLPDEVTAEFFSIDAAVVASKRIPVGVDKQSLDFVMHDFGKRSANIVASSNDSYQNFMAALAKMIADAEPESACYISSGAAIFEEELCESLAEKTLTVEAVCEAGDEEQDLPSVPKWIFIPNFSNLYSGLEQNQKESLGKGILRLHKERGTTFVVGDRPSGLSGLTYESWWTDAASLDNGIWLGNGFGDQHVLKAPNSGPFFASIPPQFGYVLVDGQAILAKMLQRREV